MAAKFVIVLSLAVAASAVPLVPVGKLAYAEPEAPAHYEYQYSVSDTHSGDVKQQHESRQGDAVQGSYSLLQPDGVTRVVDYTADKEHGFNAVVRYEGHPQAPAKLVAKVAYAPAPVYQAAPAQVYHAAPVAKVAYAAPAPVYHTAPVAKVAYAAPAQYYQSAPIAKVAYAAPAQIYHPAPVAKVAYAAPVAKVAYAPAPVYHTAPVAKVAYAAPVAKVYNENYGHVSFSSPVISYQH